MDTQALRAIIREELERAFLPCHFIISYDVNKLNEGLRSSLPAKIKELGGEERNESLYCFNGGSSATLRIVQAIRILLNAERNTTHKTTIYCITAVADKLVFEPITANS